MKFEHRLNKDTMNVSFGQMDYHESTRHLQIEIKEPGGYIGDTITLFMSIEDADSFITQFTESLEKFKRKAKIRSITEAAIDRNYEGLKRLEDESSLQNKIGSDMDDEFDRNFNL